MLILLISCFFSLHFGNYCWQRLYDHGARKFEIAGVGALGCCPAFRLKNNTECFVEANYWSVKYNEGLQSVLKELQSENEGIRYSYFDTYAALSDLTQNPASYGKYVVFNKPFVLNSFITLLVTN